MSAVIKCAALLFGAALAAELKLATFDGNQRTTASWRDFNDPVMGGASTSSFRITAARTGLFNGTCAIVSFLKAPGFAKIAGSAQFANLTGYDNIALRVRSSTPAYQGFKVAFAAPGIPSTSRYGGASYKAGFSLTGNAWQLVQIPLAQFSYDWSSYTGRCDTKDPDSAVSKGAQHYCCSKSGQQPSKPEVCVDAKFLSTINSVEIWAEGVEGDFNIEIDWVGATNAIFNSAPGSLVTFDGAAATTFKFAELNDPVMGGKSTGTWSVGEGFGVLDGEVVNVPSLKAPGFIKAAADGRFPDISDFIGGSLVLTVRTSTPEYAGYKVSFVSGAMSSQFSCAAGGSLPLSRGCFKQKFLVPAGSDFAEVKLPFHTFSDKWSSATGEHTAECATNSDVCPTAAKLGKIQRIEFWGEGAAGKLHLEVQSVSAEKTTGERMALVAPARPSWYGLGKGRMCPAWPNTAEACPLKNITDKFGEFEPVCVIHFPQIGGEFAEIQSRRCMPGEKVPYFKDSQGVFRCACCGAPLWKPHQQFDQLPASDWPWPSFHSPPLNDTDGLPSVCHRGPPAPGVVDRNATVDLGLGVKGEVGCARCGIHLGDYFDSDETGHDHYCINGVCMSPPGGAPGTTCAPTVSQSAIVI